ncbi:MAG: hypothetical protein Q7S09_05305 [bacterium]|nr:hypothetical protein [bacterium]
MHGQWLKIFLFVLSFSAFVGTANSKNTTKEMMFTEGGRYVVVYCEGGQYEAKYVRISLTRLREYAHLIQEELRAGKKETGPERTYVEIRVVDPKDFAMRLHSLDPTKEAGKIGLLILNDVVYLKSFLKADDSGFKSSLLGYLSVSYFRLNGRFPSPEETNRLVRKVDGTVANTVSVKELSLH